MIQNCLDTNSPVGISLAKPAINYNSSSTTIPNSLYGPSKICSMGTLRLVEKFDTTGIKVIVKGTHKISLGNIIQNVPYPIFQANICPDLPENKGVDQLLVDNIETILNQWVKFNVADSIERESFKQNLKTAADIADYASMFLIQDKDVRQLLLECNSLLERFQILRLLLAEKNPLQEDIQTSIALKDFEVIEKVSKLSH